MCSTDDQSKCRHVTNFLYGLGPSNIPLDVGKTDLNPAARNQMKRKSCSNPDCEHGNQLQPYSNFKEDLRCVEGRRPRCLDCEKKSRAMIDSIAQKPAEKPAIKDPKPHMPSPSSNKKADSEDLILTATESAMLKTLADYNYRTENDQIRYMIKKEYHKIHRDILK